MSVSRTSIKRKTRTAIQAVDVELAAVRADPPRNQPAAVKRLSAARRDLALAVTMSAAADAAEAKTAAMTAVALAISLATTEERRAAGVERRA